MMHHGYALCVMGEGLCARSDVCLFICGPLDSLAPESYHPCGPQCAGWFYSPSQYSEL